MSIDPKKFRQCAARHADRALTVAAEIMDDPELSPAVRLEAGKWLTKVADLEPKATPQVGGDKFSINIIFSDRSEVLEAPAIEQVGVLDRLLGEG